MTTRTAAILGWRKPTLDPEAAAFFRACRPWGFILFQGACQTRAQVRALVDALGEAVEGRPLVFIDQEGGRVARLTAPEWPLFPAAAAYGRLHAADPELGREACWLGHRLIAHELESLGIRADCAPCLDLPAQGADPIIGDRAFGTDPHQIAALGRAALDGLAAGGVAGVIKHIPGHGRADVDSHLALPRVAAGRQALAQDFVCFRALKDAPMAMTAHVVYEAYDDVRAATVSPRVISEVVRGEIGYDGLLMTDDLGMKALAGAWWDKVDGSLKAGCDMILHCSGDLAEMEDLAGALPPLEGAALDRATRAEAAVKPPQPIDLDDAWERLRGLLAHTREAMV
jgi:beta-N-acetylhexosaminidase